MVIADLVAIDGTTIPYRLTIVKALKTYLKIGYPRWNQHPIFKQVSVN